MSELISDISVNENISQPFPLVKSYRSSWVHILSRGFLPAKSHILPESCAHFSVRAIHESPLQCARHDVIHDSSGHRPRLLTSLTRFIQHHRHHNAIITNFIVLSS